MLCVGFSLCYVQLAVTNLVPRPWPQGSGPWAKGPGAGPRGPWPLGLEPWALGPGARALGPGRRGQAMPGPGAPPLWALGPRARTHQLVANKSGHKGSMILEIIFTGLNIYFSYKLGLEPSMLCPDPSKSVDDRLYSHSVQFLASGVRQMSRSSLDTQL